MVSALVAQVDHRPDAGAGRARSSRSLTLALAVASIGLFALPDTDEPRHGRGGDVGPVGRPDALHAPRSGSTGSAGGARGAAERHAPSSRSRSSTAGCTSAIAAPSCRSVGVPDFSRQRVDVVHVASGSAPRAGEVLTDVQNANQGCCASAPVPSCGSSAPTAACAGCASAARGATSRRPVRDRRRRDRALRDHGDGGLVERRARLRRAGVPAGRHAARRGPRERSRRFAACWPPSRLQPASRAADGACAG